MTTAAPSVFELGPTASWKADGRPEITFPVSSVVETGGNRLVPRERLYRPGALLDSTGPMPRSFTTVSRFFNGIREPGVPQNSYPGQLNSLIDTMELDVGVSGTLTLLTRGPIRAKPHTWTRSESDERVDLAIIQINWIHDNEDGQTAATFYPPTARAAAVPLAAQVQEILGAEGAWSADIAALLALAQALERALLLPSSYADDAEQARIAIQEVAVRIELEFANPGSGDPAGALLLGPAAFAALPALRALSELAAKAPTSGTGTAAPVPRRYDRVVSLAFVAGDVGQPLADLLTLNGGLADARRIPAGSPILVRRSS